MIILKISLILSICLCIALFTLYVYQRRKIRDYKNLLDRSTSKLEDLQVNFGRFTPSEVIEQLTDEDGRYKPSMRSVTVLFADLQGFTAFCEKHEPVKVVSILNGYFQAMSKAIAENHGQVTELMGDGILALFGALVHNPWHVQDAVNCALAMRKALEEYNTKLTEENLPTLSFGIGIHHGEVLAGVMGNFELSKFAVVGDPINVASRVEALTRQLHVDILVTDTVVKHLDKRYILNPMKAMPVKGKTDPIKTYHVVKKEQAIVGSDVNIESR